MTREIILHCLKTAICEENCENCKIYGQTGEDHCFKDAMRAAIEILEQEQCEDCISRREAIKMFTYNYKGERIPDYDCDNFPVQIYVKTVKEMLRELPPVTPQPKVGQWEWNQYDANPKIGNFHCSLCHSIGRTYFDYCPYCGAKMGGEEE